MRTNWTYRITIASATHHGVRHEYCHTRWQLLTRVLCNITRARRLSVITAKTYAAKHRARRNKQRARQELQAQRELLPELQVQLGRHRRLT